MKITLLHFLIVFQNQWLFALTTNNEKTASLKGHLQPIGHQSPIKRGEIPESDTLIPGYVFYRDYWFPGNPIVFRGALNDTQAIKNWANETYMREIYGSTFGIVDRRTTWKTGGIESPPQSVMNYSEFLDRLPYEQLYWDDEIPPKHPISRDLTIPISLDCEEIRKTFMYANLMVNSGKVSYVLHSDYGDNFFHFFSGGKTWLIANSTFRDSVYMGEGTQSRDMSPVSPDAVDLIKYPRMAEVEFHEVILKPGDILYVPRDWPHYVRSYGSPNIAMNIWFGSRFELNDDSPAIPSCKRQLYTVNRLLKQRN